MTESIPDLAFSLPEAVIGQDARKNRRSVVGLGVMVYDRKYSDAKQDDTIYISYLENLVTVVVRWLLVREYDVRLLIGDLWDIHAIREFTDLLREQLSVCDQGHIINEPICSVEDLLSQIAATDIVVATRFHNVLLALLCKRLIPLSQVGQYVV